MAAKSCLINTDTLEFEPGIGPSPGKHIGMEG